MEVDPAKLKAAIEAIKNQDGDAALALLEDIVVGAPAEGEAPPDGSATTEAAEVEPPAPGTPTAENVALGLILRATGAKDLAGAEASLRSMAAASNETVATRNAVTLAARRELIGELIALGVETPATAWEGKPELLTPKARFEAETVDDLRARVTQIKAARGLKPDARPPATGTTEGAPLDVAAAVKALKPSELAECKKRGIDPADYVARKANAVRTL